MKNISIRYMKALIIPVVSLGILVATGLAFPLPVPTTQQFFEFSPVASPVLHPDPAQTKPIGIGSVAEGGDIFNLQIGLPDFEGPVDIYCLIYVPQYWPYPVPLDSAPYYQSNPLFSFYVLKPDNTFQPLIRGLIPWKNGLTAPISAEIFGKVPTFFLAQGASYYMYLFVTPSDSISSYYIWATYFTIPMPVCGLEGCPVPLPLSN